MSIPNASGRAFIAIGSNIEPTRWLPQAVVALGELGRVAAVSRVWQSTPVGDPHQADFCNAAVLLETPLGVISLRRALREIEHRLGRVRDPHNKNAARTIDLDLSLYDDRAKADGVEADRADVVVDKPLPDPDLLTRPFVAIPLAELDPDYIHPQTGDPLSTIATRLAAHPPPLTERRDIRLVIPAAGETGG